MAKEAIYQVRMDADMKEQVEQLYQSLGTSFAEAIRIFAAQSLREQGMPFRPSNIRDKALDAPSRSSTPDLAPAESIAQIKI